MKKTYVLLVALFLAFAGQAQFEIEAFMQTDVYDMKSEFPLIRSSQRPDAARRINQSLHLEMLEKVYRDDDEERFSEVFPSEEAMWGAAEFEYEIVANNANYFSIGITCSYTGAYSEYMTRYFNFDARTGQQIMLADIFAETPLTDLAVRVNDAIEQQIVDFMGGLDRTNEFQAEQYEMYLECLEWVVDSDELAYSYYITDSTMVFVRGRCSSHMMAALDDLWDFYTTYPLEQLEEMMNDNGVALLSGGKLSFGENGIPDYKILEGTIGGKYPITAQVHRSYDNVYRGVYWYNKVKKSIQLDGTLTEQTGMLTLSEQVNEKITGEMELMVFSDGSLEGTWTDSSGETTMEIVLKIGE